MILLPTNLRKPSSYSQPTANMKRTRHVLWAISSLGLAALAACGSQSGGGVTGVNLGDPGCDAPDCSQCVNECFTKCVCQTGDQVACVQACGIGSGTPQGMGGQGGGVGPGGAGGTAGTTGVGGNAQGGTGVVTDLPPAGGARIAEISVYQSVKIPIMQNGGPVGQLNAPVVADKRAIVRVFATPDQGFQPRNLLARMTFSDGGAPLEVSRSMNGPSSEQAWDSTFNFDVPADRVKVGGGIQVSLLEPQPGASGPGDTGGAVFPASGTLPLGVQDSRGPIRVTIVPLNVNGREPLTTMQALQSYQDHFEAMYPARGAEVQVRASVPANGVSPNGGGWSSTLDMVCNLRLQDGAERTMYYFGAMAPASSFGQFCGGGCVAGLAPLNKQNSNQSRCGIGLGYFPDGSNSGTVDTTAHEIGHAHGLGHAPCGTGSGLDPYPYQGANIGAWGYNLLSGERFNPNSTKDVMSYCDPVWISDYNYERLFTRIANVNSQGKFYWDATAANRPGEFRTIHVDGQGSLDWGLVRKLNEPLFADEVQVELTDDTGATVAVRSGYFTEFDHLPGGWIQIREEYLKLPGVAGVRAPSHAGKRVLSRTAP